MNLLAEDLPAFFDMCFAGNAPVKLRVQAGLRQVEAGQGIRPPHEQEARRRGRLRLLRVDMSKANIADFMGYLMPETEKRTDITA